MWLVSGVSEEEKGVKLPSKCAVCDTYDMKGMWKCSACDAINISKSRECWKCRSPKTGSD